MAEFDFDQFKKDFMDGVSDVASNVSTAARGASDEVARYKHFFETGRDLFTTGAITSHGGNLSTSDGSAIWITRTGAMLGRLTPNDVIATTWDPSATDANASIELLVHRAAYHALAPFGQKAIVHAHTLHTIYHSMHADTIAPPDAEGAFVLGAAVPVLAPAQAIASEEAAELLATAFGGGASIAVLRGHGPFAVASTLEDAFKLISSLEQSAKLLTLLQNSQGR